MLDPKPKNIIGENIGIKILDIVGISYQIYLLRQGTNGKINK